MRRLAGEWIFRQMQMQIAKVYWRLIEESACRRWRKRQSQTHRRIVRCSLKPQTSKVKPAALFCTEAGAPFTGLPS